jgi:O-antigen/teichoic acid export membrane protein
MHSLSYMRSTFLTATASLVSMLLGAVTTKIIATLAGPAGIAIFFQLRQAAQLATIIATLNGQNSLVRGIAAREGKSSQNFAYTIGIVFLFGVALVSCVLMLPGSWAGKLLFPAGDHFLHQAAFMVAPLVILGALASYYQGVLNGYRLNYALAISQVGAALAVALVAFPLTELKHPFGYFVIVATGFVASILLSISALRSQDWRMGGLLPPVVCDTGWDKSALLEHLPFAWTTLITGSSGAALIITIRIFYIQEGGLELGGIFDAAWTISMLYVTLLLSSLGTNYLPTLSGAKTKEEIRQSVSSVFRLSTLFGVPLVCTAIVFKPWVVRVLYSQDFIPAIELLRWTMLGDYMKIAGWVFGLLLIARAERRLFVLSELAWQAVVLLGVSQLLRFTNEIAGMTYLFANSVYLIFVWRHALRAYGVRIDTKCLRNWLLGLATVAFLSFLAWDDVSTPSQFALAAYFMLLPFNLFHLTSSEERTKLVTYLRRLVKSKSKFRGGEE